MPIGKKVIRRIALYGTALLVAGVLLSPYILNQLINSDTVKRRIAREIQAYSGIDIAPETIRLVLAPLPGIRFSNFPLELSPEISIDIESVNIELDIPELLHRKIAVDRISIRNPGIRYTPGPALPGKAPKFSLDHLNNFSIPSAAVDTLYALFPDSQDDLVLDIEGIKSAFFKTMDAQLRVFKTGRKMIFRAAVQHLALDRSQLPQTEAVTALPFDRIQAKKTDLTLRLDNTGHLFGNLSITAPQITASKVKKVLAAADLNLEFTLSQEGVNVRIKPARITYPAATVGVAYLDDKKNRKTAITFTGETVSIAQAREVCLPLLAGVEVSDTLFDILRAGTAETILVGFRAASPDQLFDAEKLVIRGKAAAARVKIPQTPLIAEDVWAEVSMDKGVLHIEPSRGKVATTSIRTGVLDIDLVHDHEVPFSGTFTLDTRLEQLPGILISLLPDTLLAEELARVSGVTGTARAVLGLSMAPGQKDLAVKVRTDQIQAAGDYQRVPMPIRIDSGAFLLDKGRVYIKGMSGSLGTNPVRDLTASVSLAEEPWLNLSATGVFAIETLMPWASSHPKIMSLMQPARDVSGSLNLDSLTIEGPMFSPDLWQFSTSGRGEDVVIGFKDHPNALQAVSGRFDMSRDHLSVFDIKARAEDIGWLHFALDDDTLSSIRLPLDIFESRIDKKIHDTYIHGKLTGPAGPMASFDLKGDTLDQLLPTLLVLKDPGVTDAMVIPYQDPDKPKLSFEGRINTRTLEKLLIPKAPLHKTLLALTGGTPLTLYTDARSDLHLETDRLNLDALFPKESQKAAKKTETVKSRPLLSQKSLFFRAQELIYQNRTFTDVDSRIRFNTGTTQVDIRHAKLCGLGGNGRVDIVYGGVKPDVTTAVALQAHHDQNIADVMSCLFGTESQINGAYSFSMNLKGQGTPDTVPHQQNGSLSFQAQKGRIYKATILSRVLSVINILDADLSQNGFAYKTFTVEADISDSIVQLKKAYIDAENMAVLASGWLDPLNDKMDVTFLVAPFKTIDTIIKHIPIVNTILSGRLISLPARASGSISDPSVVPLSPTAVGKGLVNMLTDLVKAPVRLIQGEETP